MLTGGEGDDELHGQDGDDWATGMDGNDKVTGGLGIDKLYGGTGDDIVYGNEGDDTLLGDEGNDYIDGGEDNDKLLGGAGNNKLLGGAGNDMLTGGEGDDELHGQDGDDWATGMGGNDKVTGGLGIDKLYGGTGNDKLVGDHGNDTLNGDNGDDELFGLDGNDLLFGGAGADKISGGIGRNSLLGGNGDDELFGGEEGDVLIGGEGIDLLHGAGGEDLLIGSTTVYDSSISALGVLLSAWTAAAPYATRIAQIEDELFSAHLESNETVFDDQVADTIFGDEGQDWFFLTGFMGVYNPNLANGQASGHAHEQAVGGTGGHSHSGPVILDQPPELEGFALIDSLDKMGDRQQNESLHTLIPHAEDSVLQREHLSLFELARYDQVTHYAAASGAWSDPRTWHDGVVPGDGARVLIPIDVEVTVDSMIPVRIGTVRVDGELTFSTTASSELRVDTIVVSSIGRFEMGTEATPIPAGIRAQLWITDDGPIDRTVDPFGIGRGLISHGSVSMVGAVVTSHVAVNGAVLAGTNRLTLKSVPTGWKVGDALVLAGTTAGSDENEVRRIIGIGSNVVYVDRPFAFDHVPLTTDAEVHVANTTRNVSIRSESPAVDRRGHVMFMHNRNVHIANAGFYQLGRTDKSVPINDPVVDANWQLMPGTGTNPRARYAVHFHRNGFINDGNPATIAGSAVVDSPGWGFVNHSSYVDMSDNVAYDVHGAAFATEVGDEIGSFVGNIAIGSTGSGESVNSREGIQDFGHQGDGFWFQGTGVSVTGNVAAGNEGSAYIVYARGLIENGVRRKFLAANLPDPSIAKGADTIDVQQVPMRQFSDNVGYASVLGLSIRYHLRDASHELVGTFDRLSLWGNTTGIDLSYAQQVVLRDSSVVSGLATPAGVGIGLNLVTRDIRYENLTVAGYYRGIVLPRNGYAIVAGGRYDNYDDFLIETAITAGRSVTFVGSLQFSRIGMARRFEPVSNSIAHVFFEDRVIFDFGPFENQRVYYSVQAASAVPFPIAEPSVPTEYIGLTSQQLWDQFGLAVGGTLAPAGAVSVPGIFGLVGPAA